ncbi:hypothetical protein ACFL6E_04905 [Candidatus Neomarinimicrobiota bacterium]
MDWLTFISKLIESLAWPVSILVLLYIIRKELPTIVARIKKFKYKGFELEFGQPVRAVEKDVARAIPDVPEPVAVSAQSHEQKRDRLNSMAEFSPASAIVSSWLQVEAAAIDIIRKKDIARFKTRPGPMGIRDYLIEEEILDKKQIAIFEQLRKLRNKAIHVDDIEFTSESVASYINSALKLAAYLEGRANDI